MIRVLCVEDDPVMRELLDAVLRREADVQLVGTVASVREALGVLTSAPVDVVVLDWFLAEAESGLRLLQTLATWEAQRVMADLPRTLVCTGYRDEVLATAEAWGAHGVVEKPRLSTDLVPALRAVAGGSTWFLTVEPIG